MAYSQDKGNHAERLVQAFLAPLGPTTRPRVTSRTNADTGDLYGLPFVVSVKNHRSIDLAGFTDELSTMVSRRTDPCDTGVVFIKRRGRISPADWYVTTSGRLALPLLAQYVRASKSDNIAQISGDALWLEGGH